MGTTPQPWSSLRSPENADSLPPGAAGGQQLPVPRFTDYLTGATNAPGGATPTPTKLTNRPKGRWFVALILICVCGIVTYCVWNAFLRFAAYGTVEGHVVPVLPAWDGQIQHVFVREGERVEQGQLLLTQENSALRQQQSRLGDELRLAQATLAAETARLHLQAQVTSDRRQKALAEYYEAWGNLLNERAQMDLASRRVDRAKVLVAEHAIAAEEVEAAIFVEAGLQQKVEKLEVAVAELQRRAETEGGTTSELQKELEPHVLRIESLRAETARCNEQLSKEQIRAPVTGIVLKRDCLPGDHASAAQSVVTILEEGTLSIALYLPQENSHSLSPGDKLRVQIAPYARTVECEVVRVGQAFQSPPECIDRYYRTDQPVLPVFLRPVENGDSRRLLRVGGVAALPRTWQLAWRFAPVGETN